MPLDSREDILRAADIFLENGVYIETGPHKHAIQQTFFLYVYEPGGNRVEVANAGARLILAPDWKPIVWTEAERKKGQAWGLKTIKSFHTHQIAVAHDAPGEALAGAGALDSADDHTVDAFFGEDPRDGRQWGWGRSRPRRDASRPRRGSGPGGQASGWTCSWVAPDEMRGWRRYGKGFEVRAEVTPDDLVRRPPRILRLAIGRNGAAAGGQLHRLGAGEQQAAQDRLVRGTGTPASTSSRDGRRRDVRLLRGEATLLERASVMSPTAQTSRRPRTRGRAPTGTKPSASCGRPGTWRPGSPAARPRGRLASCRAPTTAAPRQ